MVPGGTDKSEGGDYENRLWHVKFEGLVNIPSFFWVMATKTYFIWEPWKLNFRFRSLLTSCCQIWSFRELQNNMDLSHSAPEKELHWISDIVTPGYCDILLFVTVLPMPIPKCPFLYCCFIWFCDYCIGYCDYFSFKFWLKVQYFWFTLPIFGPTILFKRRNLVELL